MTCSIEFGKTAVKVIKKWKRSNPRLYAKLQITLQAIRQDPRNGIGHPEPLVGYGGVTWSRRISAHDRIIYDIYDDEILVLVVSLEGHYDDK